MNAAAANINSAPREGEDSRPPIGRRWRLPTLSISAAVLVSTLAHFLMASFIEIEPPEPPGSSKLTARISAMPAPPAPSASREVLPAPTAKAKPKVRSKAPPAPPNRPESVVEPAAEIAQVAEPAPVPVAAAEPVSTEPPNPRAGELDLGVTPTGRENENLFAEGAAKEPPKPEVVAPTVEETPVPIPSVPQPHARTALLPKTIDLKFWIGLAQDGGYPMSIGRLTLRFEHDGGTYKLSMLGKASGLMAFMYPGTLNAVSSGELTPAGIRPTELKFERSDRNDRNRKIEFDWAAKEMRATNKPPVPLDGPTYDALSFILQFYFAAPEGDQIEFRVATPSGGIDTYKLKRDRDEPLKAPDGQNVPTQVWRGSRVSREGMAEFWLAPSWHFIPFKVKMTDEKQRTAVFDLEQVAVAN